MSKAIVYLKGGHPPIVVESYSITHVLTGEGKKLTPEAPFLPIDAKCAYTLTGNGQTLCFAGSEVQAILIEK